MKKFTAFKNSGRNGVEMHADDPTAATSSKGIKWVGLPLLYINGKSKALALWSIRLV